MFICRNGEGTCLSVEMLKGYMVRERLRTPALDQWAANHYLHRLFCELFSFG